MLTHSLLIYLHSFTNNELEIFNTALGGLVRYRNFSFTVSELEQVNPDNLPAMSALTFLLFKLNTLQTKIVKL